MNLLWDSVLLTIFSRGVVECFTNTVMLNLTWEIVFDKVKLNSAVSGFVNNYSNYYDNEQFNLNS